MSSLSNTQDFATSNIYIYMEQERELYAKGEKDILERDFQFKSDIEAWDMILCYNSLFIDVSNIH